MGIVLFLGHFVLWILVIGLILLFLARVVAAALGLDPTGRKYESKKRKEDD
jgi:hypothetical protein